MSDEKHAKKDFWDILHTLGPAIIAAAVGIVGGMYNYQQAQISKASEMREVYTKIMAERESSDNSIRATMFEMLFNAMFAKGFGSANSNPDDIHNIKQQVMFLDVLSRNFDTVDIKPLFEDLDSELTKKIYDGKDYSVDQRGNYFEMRSELRRIGKNLSIKQLNALASLPDSVVKTIVLLQDMKGNIQTMQDETASNGNGDTIPVEIKPEGISDGMVNISLEYQKTKASDQGIKAPSFIITFMTCLTLITASSTRTCAWGLSLPSTFPCATWICSRTDWKGNSSRITKTSRRAGSRNTPNFVSSNSLQNILVTGTGHTSRKSCKTWSRNKRKRSMRTSVPCSNRPV
jgi:hypothetical protein